VRAQQRRKQNGGGGGGTQMGALPARQHERPTMKLYTSTFRMEPFGYALHWWEARRVERLLGKAQRAWRGAAPPLT